MAKKAVKKGEAFIAEVLAKIPEEQRETVRAALQAEDVLDYVGSAALRQEEFSNGMSEAQRLKTEADTLIAKNQEWYQANLPLLNKGAKADDLDKEVKKLTKRLKALQADPDTTDEDVDAVTTKSQKALENLLTKEEAAAMVAEAVRNSTLSTQASGLDLIMTINDLSAQHFHNYKEPLNSRELIAFAQKNGTTITAAYATLTKEKAEAASEAAKAAEKAALRAEVEAEFRKTQTARGHEVYPIGGAEPLSSTLGALTEKPKGNSVDRAVAAYQDLLSKKGA